MQRKFNFAPGEYYHIYSRGTEKREIFSDTLDYERFLKMLFLSNGTESIVFRDIPREKIYSYPKGKPLTSIGAYCLMPNHFHLLLKEEGESDISRFVGKLLTSHSMYFNTKYQRTGSLFQGTFQARHVRDDNYLKYLFAYIHLNPVKMIDSQWKEKGILDIKRSKDFLSHYKFSSYQDYVGMKREEKMILNVKVFPDYFETVHTFSDFIDEWLCFKDSNEYIG